YAGFTQSLQAEWQYLCRCVLGVEVHLKPAEAAIDEVLSFDHSIAGGHAGGGERGFPETALTWREAGRHQHPQPGSGAAASELAGGLRVSRGLADGKHTAGLLGAQAVRAEGWLAQKLARSELVRCRPL
ncbi:hypothetical protein ACHAXR_002355, partial [Thalassiosira sp. AJA248-18]